MSLGKRLKQARKQVGYTQEQLAERIGVSRAAVARFEAGEIEPSLKTLVALADTLCLSTDGLLGRSAPKTELSPAARAALALFIQRVREDADRKTEDQ